ncbi:MAG: hypothetical protein WC178_03530 [Candidatus Paceibacterota bacterium]|jgi:hypothetical protein
MKEITRKLNAYKALIKSGKHSIKELRKRGFKFDTDTSYGSIFRQVDGFSQSCYEADNDL